MKNLKLLGNEKKILRRRDYLNRPEMEELAMSPPKEEEIEVTSTEEKMKKS